MWWWTHTGPNEFLMWNFCIVENKLFLFVGYDINALQSFVMCQGGMQYTNWYHNICTSSVCSLLEDIWREYLDFDAVIEQRKLHNESYNHHFNIFKCKFQGIQN
jgi:hypothetical protein